MPQQGNGGSKPSKGPLKNAGTKPCSERGRNAGHVRRAGRSIAIQQHCQILDQAGWRRPRGGVSACFSGASGDVIRAYLQSVLGEMNGPAVVIGYCSRLLIRQVPDGNSGPAAHGVHTAPERLMWEV